MTRRGEGNEDIEGGLRKFLDTLKVGSEKIRGGFENLYTSKPTGGGEGGSLKVQQLARGAAKISSSEFQYLHLPLPPTPPPLVILNELSLSLRKQLLIWISQFLEITKATIDYSLH